MALCVCVLVFGVFEVTDWFVYEAKALSTVLSTASLDKSPQSRERGWNDLSLFISSFGFG